ncbi:MAG: tetratricopeptide repeat protein, partial [Phyllobacteriaceae bacterium]|nr:tetratricopeptide repeat protein [Phyllobacteriaceae bacterium]
MADIFNEIDEELRQEKLKKFWDRWGVAILAAAVAVVLAVAGWRVWDHYRQKAAEAQGDAFLAATR